MVEEKADWQIDWEDFGREPKSEPNPKYPEGIDIDIAYRTGATKTCSARLTYPAPRCGAFRVMCRECGQRAYVTTAGRLDDPRSLRMPCRERKLL